MKKNYLFIRQIMRIYCIVAFLLLTITQVIIAGRTNAQVLMQPVDISIRDQTLGDALVAFAKVIRAPLAYDGKVLGVHQISVRHKTFLKAPAREVLEYLLQNTQIAYKESREGIVLVPRKQQLLGTLAGTVTNDKGEALPGATIQVLETGQVGQSRPDGTFSLQLAPGHYNLKVSFISYQSAHLKQVAVETGKTTRLKISLQADRSNLNEVVVVGYETRLKSEVTGAISRISAESLGNRPITQASQALYGLMPGVYLNAPTGEAGNNEATIRVRGIGTLNDAGALILVDGIEASINNINPDDIESITVLKDASAAAIYGSRAANGVVLVTTKRGKLNSRPVVGYNFSTGFSQPTVLPDMVTDPRTYLELYREAADNSDTKYKFTDADIDRYAALPATDWLKVGFRKNAPIQQHAVSLRGGGEKSAYSLSLGYLNQDGIIRGGQNYKAYNIRLNLDNSVTEKLKIGASLAFSYADTRYTPKDDAAGNDLSGKGNLAFEGALMQHPIVPVYDAQGRYAALEQQLGLASSRNNGQGILDNQFALEKNNKLLGSVYAEYELIKNLKVRGTVGHHYQHGDYTDTRREFSQYDVVTGDLATTVFPGSQLYDIEKTSRNVTAFVQAAYEKKVGRHTLRALAGYNQESYNGKTNTVQQIEFETTSMIRLGSGASTPKANTGRGSWALRSYFGRLNYDFSNRYLFEVNFRRDGSSRFGANNRYGNFPSFSAGWLVSNEPFWNTNVVDFLKFRASWGILGNQNTDMYPFATQVSLTNRYAFNNTVNNGGAYSVIGNPDLKWEQTQSANVGIDAAFFRSKLTLEADYFIKQASGILTEIENPLSLGIDKPTTVNAAAVENKGWELNLNYRDKIGQVSLGGGFNLSYITNKVKSINPSLTDESDRVALSESANEWLIRGESIGVIYGYGMQGIFQDASEISHAPDHKALFGVAPQPGDFRVRDVDGNGIIDKNDKVVIGNRVPKLLYGFNLKAGYKGFDLSLLFQGIGRTDVYLARGTAPFPFAGIRADWLNRWTPEQPSATYPRLWVDRKGYNGSTVEVNHTSFWVQDRAYLRLKNIQLAYTLPQSVIRKIGVQRLGVFVNAQNLLTFTSFKDFDPERQDKTQYATSALPQLKIFTAGVNVSF